jgi:hypothetical protein
MVRASYQVGRPYAGMIYAGDTKHFTTVIVYDVYSRLEIKY